MRRTFIVTLSITTDFTPNDNIDSVKVARLVRNALFEGLQPVEDELNFEMVSTVEVRPEPEDTTGH